VHSGGLSSLPPVLRVYEGCAQTLTGTVDGATILKMHRLKPQVSFLVYSRFNQDAHPTLEASIVARLGTLSVTYKDFADRENPPILHRKELFVPEDYPGRERFARLTAQEEQAQLLDSPSIGTLNGWRDALSAKRVSVKGHRLVQG
jgi:DNA phosphorothioation-associated putative methyltransferase